MLYINVADLRLTYLMQIHQKKNSLREFQLSCTFIFHLWSFIEDDNSHARCTAAVFDKRIPLQLMGLSLVWMRSWQSSSSTEIPVNGFWSLRRLQIKTFSQEKKRRHKKRIFHSIRSGISWKLLATAMSHRGNMNLLRSFTDEICIENWLLDYYYQMHVCTYMPSLTIQIPYINANKMAFHVHFHDAYLYTYLN